MARRETRGRGGNSAVEAQPLTTDAGAGGGPGPATNPGGGPGPVTNPGGGPGPVTDAGAGAGPGPATIQPTAALKALRPMGLRERKRMRTMAVIQQAALRLFAAQGYQATTVDQIAAAAGVSPATFFRYYPSKEDVVRSDEFDDLLLGELARRPPEENAYEAVAAACRAIIPYLEEARELVIERARLVLQTPSLHAQLWEAYRANLDMCATALALRLGQDPAGLEVRALAAAATAAAFEAMMAWVLSDGTADLSELLDRCLGGLSAGGLPLGAAGRPERPPNAD